MKIGWVISIFLLDGSVLSVIYSNSLFDVPQVYDIYKYGVYIYDIFILRWFIMVRQVLTFLPHSRHVAISTPPQEQLLRRKGGTQRLERKIREWHFL